jgi:transposase
VGRRHGAGDRRPAHRQVRPAQIFVAVMGASNFTYAEASWTQALADWIGAHTRAFAAIGGVPKLLVPDNTKSLPSRKRGWLSSGPVSTSRRSIGPQPSLGQALRRDGGPLRYRDPAGSAARQGEGRSCGADHRAMVARPPAPPSLLQFGRTQYDDRRVVAAAQRRTPDRRLGVTRRALFEELDRPNLNSLPAQSYCFAEWRVRRVGVDYHVELDGHFDSVPYRFARSEVEVRLTPRAVEIFLKGERIAAHLRASGNHRHTTVSEHMPSSHRRYADWTVERIRREAASIGPATAALCELILERRPHPEQGFRACLGIVRLVRPFGADRLEAAATRAIEIGTLTDGSVRSILDNKLDRQAAQRSPANGVPILHPNIRGPRYYH